jgi:translocator protein
MIWRARPAAGSELALGIFFVQLVLNFLWSVIFFRLESPGVALCDIFLLLAAVAGTIVAFYAVRPWAGAILMPYLAWVSFASYLNGAIWWLNRGAAGKS